MVVPVSEYHYSRSNWAVKFAFNRRKYYPTRLMLLHKPLPWNIIIGSIRSDDIPLAILFAIFSSFFQTNMIKYKTVLSKDNECKICYFHSYTNTYKNELPFSSISGWFSVISGNNTTGSARVYRRVDSLVRAGVPAFLLAAPLRAYILTHSKMGKWKYCEYEIRAKL